MKKLSQYITEKFRLNSKTIAKVKGYSCHPKDRFELRKILEERLKKDKNADLNDIDVSKIDDMNYRAGIVSGLFFGLDPHNIDVSEWDVSNVKDLACLFHECENFNCDLSNWDVSICENLSSMFANCKKFKGEGLENWDTSNVKKLFRTFYNCTSLNIKNIENWNVSKSSFMDSCFNCENTPKWYIE